MYPRYFVNTSDAIKLPFADGAFDYVVSIAALCFVADDAQAMREIARVARKGWAIGLLNRHSLLYLQKGQGVGRGAYRGAHWHSPQQALAMAGGEPGVRRASAIFLPGGGRISRWLEPRLPATLPLGAFLLLSGGGSSPLSCSSRNRVPDRSCAPARPRCGRQWRRWGSAPSEPRLTAAWSGTAPR